jgi:hypothetical protein
VNLEQLQAQIQIFNQAEALDHQMHRAHAAATQARNAGRHLVVNVAGSEHRPRLILPVFGLEPTGDSLLAVAKNLAVASIHSKWPFVDCCRA